MTLTDFINAELLNKSCVFSKSGLYIVPSFTVVWGFLFFPLCTLVLHTGFQRWRRNRRATVSHTDFFTYNNLAFNLLNVCAYVAYSVASFQSQFEVMYFSACVLIFVGPGLQFLHVLTCVERYLAVVRPVVFLSLKEKKWIWARSATVFVIWLFCFGWVAVVMGLEYSFIPLLTMLSAVACVISFCCVQVLRALRNPSPGEGRGVGRSKRKAFCAMMAILSALMLWLDGEIVKIIVLKAHLLEHSELCKFQKSTCWFELPSGLVLPLLFLHRAGNLSKRQGKKTKHSGLE